MPIDITTLRELIDLLADTQPDGVFLVSPETHKTVTFRSLQQRSKLLSSELLQSGLKPGDKIAFLLDNGLFTAHLFLGAMYGGFVAVPLNVRAGVSQLSYTLGHCDANVVYVSKEYATLIEEVMANVPRKVRVIPADVDDSPSSGEMPALSELTAPAPEDPALLMYTSGSTGRPKAAVHSHRTILAGARNSIAAHQLTSSDRSLLVLPLYHINAECVTLIPTLMSGGSVVVPHRFSISQFWDWLDEHQCTWSAIVPTIVSQLLDWQDPLADRREPLFRRIRFLRSSSAPLAPSLHREFLDKFPLLLIQAMGSSEAGNVFSNPLPPGENKIGSPGVPWGFEVKIVDHEGLDVTPGEAGEMLIRGPAMTQSYYKEPGETAAAFDADSWLHTGDLAYKDKDGYYFVVGRSKELIIKGGVNIAPRQIDDVLESHPTVLEAAAVGIPDHHLGEELVAFVVLRYGAVRDEAALLRFCEARLGHFKTPTRVYFANNLPKGPSGKVQRLRLRDEATQFLIDGSAQSGPEFGSKHTDGHASETLEVATSSIETVLAESWAEVLRRPHIEPDSNFFALGGHSLLAVQCVSSLREQLPVALSLSDFFENPTIAKQAALVRHRLHLNEGANAQALIGRSPQLFASTSSAVGSPLTISTIPRRNELLPCPLSPGQRRLLFLEMLNPGLRAYNEVEAVRLLGPLDFVALKQALNAIVARHEILRTTINVSDDQPAATVHASWPIKIKKIDLGLLRQEDRDATVERLLVHEPREQYDLDKTPGIRATLLCLGAEEHIFILMMHHIICDWSSVGVIWRELSALYRSISRGEAHALPLVGIQHGDYAAWKVRRDTETNFEQDLAFWEENLRDAPQVLELPTDRPRPPRFSYAGARQRIVLDLALTNALRNLSQQANATSFAVFAAALITLLYRYSGQEDILLGVPIADRDRKELQHMLGFLLDTQVLRAELSEDLTFRRLLATVQKKALDIYLHRAIPFDRVVRAIRPERNASHSPLFQVMLIWRDHEQMLPFIGLDGLRVESLLVDNQTSKFDLTLFVTDAGDEIWLDTEYSTDLFDEARITRMLGHFRTLLESISNDPDKRLAELPILTPAEHYSMLVGWNDAKRPYPKDRRLHELIEEQVHHTPDAVAVVFEDKKLTYRELDDRANHLAHRLRSLGVGPNVLVGIFIERSLEMLVALYGVLKAGGAYVPLDPSFPADRLAYMVEDCQPRVILSLKRMRIPFPRHKAQIVWLDSPSGEAGDVSGVLGQGCEATDLAYVLYTSGSTGKPKGVQISNKALLNFLTAMKREPGLVSSDTLLAVTTLSFDIAALELFLPLLCGARVVIASREAAADAQRLWSLMKRCQPTVMQATPATWRLLLEAGWKGSPDLKLLCGGESWPPSLATDLLGQCKTLWNMYGPTETTIWSSVTRVESGKQVLIGPPISNTSFYVLDKNRELVPVGVPGELYIGGDGVAQGYLNRPDLTEERFVRDPFTDEPEARLYKTGDIVRRLSDGMMEFLHRDDLQVKIRGFRIELGEIEYILKQHPAVGECVVVSREDVPGMQRLVAYIVLSKLRNIPPGNELRSFLKEKLPPYMIPAVFATLERLPLTPNGKLDRRMLPLPEGFRQDRSEEDPAAPRNPVEFRLLQIWEEILGAETIGIRDNFFDLGGHSLLAVQLFARIEKVFRTKLPLATLYKAPTIENLALLISGEVALSRWSPLVPIQPLGSRPPFFCFHAAGGNVLNYRQLSQCMGPEQPLYGLQSQGLDGTSAPLTTIEQMAELYVKAIRSVQPHGPYLLGGYCLGGTIAYEVAQQLRAAGETISLLALFDTLNWRLISMGGWAKFTRALQRISFHGMGLLSLDWEDRAKFFNGKIEVLRNRIPVWGGMLRSKLSRRDREPGPGISIFGRIWQTNHRAARKYVAKPYPGLITDIRPAKQYWALDKPNLKWERLAQNGQRTITLPAYPGAMLVEPFVQHLAQALMASIDQVTAESKVDAEEVFAE